MAARSNDPRQLVRDEARVIVAKAARGDGVVFPAREAKRIVQNHPQGGMTEDEIRRELSQLAVERRLAVDPSG